MIKNDNGPLDRSTAEAEIKERLSNLVYLGSLIGQSEIRNSGGYATFLRERVAEVQKKTMELISAFADDARDLGREKYEESDEYMENVMQRRANVYAAVRRVIDEAENEGLDWEME